MRTVFTVAVSFARNSAALELWSMRNPEQENFYSRYGFVELEAVEGMLEERPTPKPMFLPLSAIMRALGPVRAKKPD